MDVDIGAYEDISSADATHVIDALIGALPKLEEHQCSLGTRGGFVARLQRGTYAAHITEHVALELQAMIGHNGRYGRTRGTGGVGAYTLVFEHVLEMVGLRAAALALETVQRAFQGTLDSVAHAVAELHAIAMTPTLPPLRQRVRCGITGGTARSRDALGALGVGGGMHTASAEGEHLVIDVSPMYILEAGLPYSHADVAVILDATLTDVPERYRDPERAARLVAVMADAVPTHGYVVCPSDAYYVHDLVRNAERQIVPFTQEDDPAERARQAAAVAVWCLNQLSSRHSVAHGQR